MPVMVMSGSNREEKDVRSALKAGANDFILKPIDPLMMSSKISRILMNRVDWGEWSLKETNISAVGDVRVKIEVLSISEMGMRIFSTVPLQLKSAPQISIPLLDELGIPAPFLEVLECVKTADGFSSYLTFIGMPESHLKKVRLLCRRLATARAHKKEA